MLLKTAHWVEKPQIDDKDFAVILVDNEGNEHRKFAMHDLGNTAVSVVYFLSQEHDMGEAATKLAAANLLTSLYYQGTSAGMGVVGSPEFTKLAEIRGDIEELSHHRDIIDERKAYYKPTPVVEPEPEPEVNPYDLIKTASANWASVNPYDRRHTAMQLQMVAEHYATDLPQKIAAYTGDAISPMLPQYLEHRIRNTKEAGAVDRYTKMLKMAHAGRFTSYPPEEVVEAIFLIDEMAGHLNKYGSSFPDPVLMVFDKGIKKEAEWSWSRGGDYVNERQLVQFAGSFSAYKKLDGIFGEEFRKAFAREPVKMFNRMPAPQQSILARMATDSGDHNDGGR